MANYRTNETAYVLSISRTMVDAIRRNGVIHSFKIGKNYEFSDADIEEFLDTYIGKKITKEGFVLNEG